jgi:pyruvate ferredoxin oxidoreductase beta subunit
MKGPRLIITFAPCPTGWLYDPEHSVEIGHLAVKTGLWPLKEYEGGKTVHTLKPHPRVPVEEYLRLQGRYRHLFEPARDEAAIAAIQAGIEAYWAKAA